MTELTRRYDFSASHRLHVPSFTDEQNAELYGKCNNPYGHGHNYTIEIRVRGPVNEETGRVVSPGALDRYVRERVLDRLDHRDMNHDIPEFAGLVPTTENLARVIDRQLRADWQRHFTGTELAGVRIQETRRNFFELRSE